MILQQTLLYPDCAAPSMEHVTRSDGRARTAEVLRATLAQSPIMPLPAASVAQRPTPQTLAWLHNQYYSALWRGDDVEAVTDWLETHWSDQGTPEPDGVP